MVAKRGVDVDVIRGFFILGTAILLPFVVIAQADSTKTFKKRVLDNVEIDFLTSYYSQNGDHASVTGGIGTENLQDINPTIVVSIPIKDDNILAINGSISAYTSASSSNLDPFDNSGASRGYDNDDDDDDFGSYSPGEITASPWVASSGASRKDIWTNFTLNYSHYSEDRNEIIAVHGSVASEYDYFSLGFGGVFTKLWNEKNTEASISANAYFDQWIPVYPTELDSYYEAGESLIRGFFSGLTILDEHGRAINKFGSNVWAPKQSIQIDNTSRNSYTLSLSFSQILSKNAQLLLLADIVQQDGWLSNPLQRVYFGDIPNFYVGNASDIPHYTTNQNNHVFQLADDIERLPGIRTKMALGTRFNYYINERFVLRLFYRLYMDDWGINAHTANLELPIKVGNHFTLYPSYRYYNQTAANYFGRYEENLSTDNYYTSDFDLSGFSANQIGFGVSHTDPYLSRKLGKLAIKSMDVRYHRYLRSNTLKAHLISAGISFVVQKD